MILVMKMPGSSPIWGLSVPPAMLKPNPELPCGHENLIDTKAEPIFIVWWKNVSYPFTFQILSCLCSTWGGFPWSVSTTANVTNESSLNDNTVFTRKQVNDVSQRRQAWTISDRTSVNRRQTESSGAFLGSCVRLLLAFTGRDFYILFICCR